MEMVGKGWMGFVSIVDIYRSLIEEIRVNYVTYIYYYFSCLVGF